MKPKSRECDHCRGSYLSSPTPRYCATCYRTAVNGWNCAHCNKPITKSKCGAREGKVIWDGSSERSPRRLNGVKEDIERQVVVYATSEALNGAILRWTERDLNVNGPFGEVEDSRDPFTGKPRKETNNEPGD